MSLNLYDVVFARGLGGGNGGSGGGSYKGMTIHVCASSEYDIETNIPTISEPDDQTIYLVPGNGDENNMFNEYIYVDGTWELFGSATVDLSLDSTPTANSTNPVTSGGVKTALDGKQNTLTFDTTPTEYSTNPVTSGGIKTALNGKQDTLAFDTTPTANSTKPVTSGGIKTALDGKQNTLTFDTAPTVNSTKPVTSGGIKTAINAKQDKLIFDSVPTASSTNPVTSGGVKSALNDIEMQLTAATKSPLKANTVAAMSDTTKTYIYTGNETGYTFGNWYYYDGSSWTDGGIYNATAFETDKTLTIENMAADSKAVGDLKEALTDVSTDLTHKADKDGTVASAEQLLSDVGTEDKQPYLFRATPYDSTRVDEEVVGVSVGWNQLVGSDTSSVTVTSGHKLYTVIGGTASIVASDGTAISVTGGTDMVVDLTAWFGSTIADYAYSLEQATAGSGVAWINALLPGGYIPYSAPKMESVSGLSGHRFVGFNAFDKSNITQGVRLTATGGTTSSSNAFVSDYIPVLPGKDYYLLDVIARNVGVNACAYDENKTFISALAVSGTTAVSGVVTTPSNAKYVRINGYIDHLDSCGINLSDPAKNGTYEPYKETTYALDSDLTLRGILKMDSAHNVYADGDVYLGEGKKNERYAEVDLGTLDWTAQTLSGGRTAFYTSYGTWSATPKVNNSATANAICAVVSRQTYQTATTWGSDVFLFSPATGTLPEGTLAFIFDDSKYANATAFKTAMTGQKLVYEKTAVSTAEALPYASPQNCSPGGTEEYVYAEGGSGIPVGHNSKYQANLKGELERVMVAVPKTPTNNGTYSLKATVASTGVTYAWVSD